MNLEQISQQVAQTWEIEQLCKDLAKAKQRYRNVEKSQSLSQQKSDCLCGFFCNYSPQEIAQILNVKVNGLQVNLSRNLYRYIETLILNHNENNETPPITWSSIPRLLEELGYRRTQPPPPAENWVKWRISIDLPEIAAEQLEQIQIILKQIPGNASLRLDKIERGSIQLVFDGTSGGFERIQELFSTGELSELLGVPILAVKLEQAEPTPVNLSLWVQNVWEQALEAGWQTIEEVFGSQQLGFRSAVVTRAKLLDWRSSAVKLKGAKFIDLESTVPLALVVDLPRKSEGEIEILLRVYPIQDLTDLPENLKFILLDESGEVLWEVSAGSGNDCIEQPLSGEPGERFAVRLELGAIAVTEYFMI